MPLLLDLYFEVFPSQSGEFSFVLYPGVNSVSGMLVSLSIMGHSQWYTPFEMLECHQSSGLRATDCLCFLVSLHSMLPFSQQQCFNLCPKRERAYISCPSRGLRGFFWWCFCLFVCFQDERCEPSSCIFCTSCTILSQICTTEQYCPLYFLWVSNESSWSRI